MRTTRTKDELSGPSCPTRVGAHLLKLLHPWSTLRLVLMYILAAEVERRCADVWLDRVEWSQVHPRSDVVGTSGER